jgi:hypothetical protein
MSRPPMRTDSVNIPSTLTSGLSLLAPAFVRNTRTSISQRKATWTGVQCVGGGSCSAATFQVLARSLATSPTRGCAKANEADFLQPTTLTAYNSSEASLRGKKIKPVAEASAT